MSSKKLKKNYKETLDSCTPQPGKTASKTNKVVPKSINQRDYLQAIEENDLVFAVGPAGGGKTYLATAMAVSYFLQNKVKKIILVRPAVEAGEKLGFMPGDMRSKIEVYFLPVYEALHSLLEPAKVEELIESGLIELAPIAFMRGRTLSNAAVIVDEAQNTTVEQMKMVITRLGFGSKMIVTGDPSQVDLPKHIKSGLTDAEEVLDGVPGIAFCYFDESDIIRSPLVKAIVTAYQNRESSLT